MKNHSSMPDRSSTSDHSCISDSKTASRSACRIEIRNARIVSRNVHRTEIRIVRNASLSVYRTEIRSACRKDRSIMLHQRQRSLTAENAQMESWRYFRTDMGLSAVRIICREKMIFMYHLPRSADLTWKQETLSKEISVLRHRVRSSAPFYMSLPSMDSIQVKVRNDIISRTWRRFFQTRDLKWKDRVEQLRWESWIWSALSVKAREVWSYLLRKQVRQLF